MRGRSWFPGLAAALMALAAAPGAAAHATLEQSTPANDAVVERSPEQVTLRFTEPVEAPAGSVRVLDASSRRVDDGRISLPSPDTVSAGLRPELPDGTYTVAWRVVSADTHTVFGAFVFHVGHPGANPEGGVSRVLEQEQTPKTVSVLFTAIRFFSFGLLFLCAGGTAALALVLTRAGDEVRRRLYGVLAACALGLALVSLFGIVLQGGTRQGLSLANAFRWSVAEPVLDTRFGQVWLARAGLAGILAAVALILRRRGGPGLLLDLGLLLCVGLVISPAAAGHAEVAGALAFVSDVVHVQAGAIWAGGLAFLLLALLITHSGRWELAAIAVPRFSRIAVISVSALLVAGVTSGYLEVRTWSGLWETTYGRLVLVKAGLVLPLLGLGLYNNRRSVPRLRAGSASAPERRRFLQTTLVELGIVVAVLAVAAVLVAQPPAKSVVEPTGRYSTTAELGPLELNLVVDPAKAGSNAIHLNLLSRTTGQPANAAEVRVLASLASARIGPLQFEARRLTSGHYVVTEAALPQPGDWQLRVEARRGKFDLFVQTISVPIRKDT